MRDTISIDKFYRTYDKDSDYITTNFSFKLTEINSEALDNVAIKMKRSCKYTLDELRKVANDYYSSYASTGVVKVDAITNVDNKLSTEITKDSSRILIRLMKPHSSKSFPVIVSQTIIDNIFI